MATRYTTVGIAGAAALVASSIGASLYTASSAEQARQAITASYDPTTRHGEVAVRVDAGGADVTALAAVDPGTTGQVFTVGDAGIPVWRTPASGTVTASQISDSTTTGRAVLTAASEAAARTAIGAQAATWTSVTASSFSRRDGTRGTVVLTGARLDFTVDGAALAYYDGTARTAARAYYAVPSTATDVAMVHRLYTRTSGAAQSYTGVTSLLRSGSDDTTAPGSVTSYYANTPTNAIILPGVARINDGGRNYYGDYNAAGAYGTGGTGGVAWPANTVVDDTWLGVRWREGAITYGVVVAPATSPPAVADFQWLSPPHTARWAGPPSLAVLTVTQVGGTPSAQAITAECVLYYR